ncbi:MAG: transcription termination factor NusA [Geminocystis sp.]|nr:transcription termination factor NusA [Geminocystis sp.]HIK38714.1 transcription termination factor NusA [Geminocystis sp. M7585_C2015_104]MCS7148867.1 transcription termination factor NusA [Geminocystis sp.]MCX8078842.1 transcription termination factor NusA [Geminocystis sp.]MDW8115951.1 transcription termination factor NusA [Geminocystis sp.]
MSLVKLPGLQNLINEISQTHNLPKSCVEEAIREALFKGYERFRRSKSIAKGHHSFPPDYFHNFRVQLDLEEEGFRVVALKTVTETVEDPDHQIALAEVKEFNEEAQLGDEVLVNVTPDQQEFGRMAAMQTKQVLLQKLKELQRAMIQEEFAELEGTVLPAKVLRFEGQSVIMTVQSAYGRPEVEAELPRAEQIASDNYRANATFKVYLKKVKRGVHRGSQLLVSRADAGLVVYLFANEVPEIEDGIVRIVAIAREANPPKPELTARTKMAVDTLDPDVDPVGACIGARGSRIQAVVNELKGEKIDVIRWSPDPATYIANALSPAKVDKVEILDPEEKQALVIVPDNQFSLAIGKDGQNVRLAARLTGWKIDIKRKSDADGKAN